MLSSLFAVPVSAAYHLVLFLAGVLAPVFGPASAAAAIVLFTLAVRAAMLPLSAAQYRGERTRSRLLPAMRDLQKKHEQDPERMQRELNALYAKEGASPLTGCLPTLIQLPIFSVMYRLFVSPTVGGQPNLLLTRQLAGAPLGTHWFSEVTGSGVFGAHSLVFLALFGLLAVVGWWSSKRIPEPEQPTTLTRLLRLLPYGTVLVAAVMPLADGLYLLATTAWAVIERTLRTRTPPAAPRVSEGRVSMGR